MKDLLHLSGGDSGGSISLEKKARQMINTRRRAGGKGAKVLTMPEKVVPVKEMSRTVMDVPRSSGSTYRNRLRPRAFLHR